VTRFQEQHPGGSLLFEGIAGSDVTLPFGVYHANDEKKVAPFMKAIRVGSIERTRSPLTQAFEKLHEALKKDGMYTYDFTSYVIYFGWYAALFLLSWMLMTSGEKMKICLGSVVLGAFWQQMAFFGHDVGHNSVTQKRVEDWKYGLVVNFFFGVSGQWWKHNHNTHHIFCNSVNWDPTVQHLPLFALNDSFAKGYWSFYHSKFFQSNAFTQLLLSYQHFLYLPVMALARWKMYVASFQHLLIKKNVYGRWEELTCVSLFWVWYVYLISTMPSFSIQLISMLISHAAVGILHMQITMNHFIMPTYEGSGFSSDDKGDHWIKMQLETSADIACTPSLDFFWGGLQFQVAHHLFPRIPRANLRSLREQYLIPFCKEHDLVYYVAPGFWRTLTQTLSVLMDEAMRVRGGEIVPLSKSKLATIFAEAIDG